MRWCRVPERRRLRVLHTSDVHLGAYPSRHDGFWEAKRRELEAAFSGVVAAGIREHADALLIAGDFFDNDRVDDSTVRFAVREIRRFPGTVFLIPGNHDAMDPGRLYWRHDFEAMAPNLRLFRDHGGGVFEEPELDLVVWGRALHDADWHFRPLDGLPSRLDGRWHVALAHGHTVGPGDDHGRSWLIHHEQIEAAAGQWDYLAFGHWEHHADVSRGSATAVYSGAPQALGSHNENAGRAVLVDFDEHGVRWRAVPVRG
jgi:DNA repair exonuclease SbcCD nuclease subunit